MSDLSVEEFDFHTSFINNTVWPALIGDQPWWKKASTWCIVSGVLIAFLFGAIIVLLNGNEQQLLLNVNNQQLELLNKLEKNVQETINSSFKNKHKVIADEIEGIINASIDDKMERHFSKLAQLLQNAAIIVAVATVLILTTVKLWGMFKIALIRRNTAQPSEVKMVEEPAIPLEAEAWWQFHSIPLPKCADFVALRLQPINLEEEANNDVNDNGGEQQLLIVDELPEERDVREEEEEPTDKEEETKHEEEEEESTHEEEKEVMEKNSRTTHADEGKKFKCTECAYQAARPDHLKRHMRAHTGERPFKCTICGHQVTRSEHLKEHMRTHTGEKPYKCTICGLQFPQSSGLKYHMSCTHTAEGSKFKCTICGHQSAHAGNLKEHMRTHTGEKPYKCTICGRRFRQSSGLKHHMRRNHTGEK